MPPSNFLEYLPEIYETDPFAGQFLLAFEKILLGVKNDDIPLPELQNKKFPRQSLEEIIAGLATYFEPQQTPSEFISWLASWTALSLRADIDSSIQRQFIANVVKHYQLRGTKANLEDLLRIFVRGKPSVTETSVAEFQIGVSSTIGKDTYLRGGPPHFFTVSIALAEELKGKPQELARQLEIANALIQLEKPAHTDYQLIPIFPGTIRIGDRTSSVLGVNTILGNMPTPGE
ncbi:MAG: hypothetical protein KME23_08440 [Goleter apudmare HA4340-LM2]|jgi:phage tail-like protein|nr:hypothetical protein [Goleter apudmare HA4340-LM2]